LDILTIGIAQIAPVWLDRNATVAKVVAATGEAARAGCDLVVFGEGLIPGYPFWVELTDGTRFDDSRQKEMFAHYLDQAVVLERGDLSPVCDACQAPGHRRLDRRIVSRSRWCRLRGEAFRWCRSRLCS
jgi:nitrilase